MKYRFFLNALLLASVIVAKAQQFAERLDRGAVAYSGTGGMFVSWRSLASDEPGLTFDLYRDDTKVNASPIDKATSYVDTKGKTNNAYTIKALLNGDVVEEFVAKPWAAAKKLHLNRPAAGKNADGNYDYSPNDCSVGDVDGDGEYEIVVKWDPSNSKDNSQGGYTGNVLLDCYKMDGSQLWRIDLGVNIRAGAHYTQFLVYDFDGDGRAEMICKTGPGSKDGTDTFVSEAATDSKIKAADNKKDWRNLDGRIDGGGEWLTVFEGLTGKAIHTIHYNPNRNTTVGGEAAGTFNWDDRSGKKDYASYGNRGERYLAAVAHLNGTDAPASAVMARGYYTFAFIWAVDFDGKELTTHWLHSAKSTTSYTVKDSAGKSKTYSAAAPTGKSNGSRTAYANGNHNMSVADVDGDGKDEIVWGACAIDDDGKLMYSTGYGHGDAMHVGKMIPDSEGLQVFQVHESAPYGWDLHDAATGKILQSGTSTKDTGRGIAADVDGKSAGWEFWCAADRTPRNAATGKTSGSVNPSMNFRVYWDGDLQDELLDGNTITKWSASGISTLATLAGNSCNSTKATPNLVADILGDWREEVILWDSSTKSDLYIHSTKTKTNYRVPCLMQDHTYRMAVAWQNCAYNQPPHLGYYLPDYVKSLQEATPIELPTVPHATSTAVYALSGVKFPEIHSALNSLLPGMRIVVATDEAGRTIKRVAKEQ